jgi:hypothetical protein
LVLALVWNVSPSQMPPTAHRPPPTARHPPPTARRPPQAQLLSRYSELVLSVLPFIDLRSGAGTTAAIQAVKRLRGLVLAQHKATFIDKILAEVRGRAEGGGGMPSFKVSRAKTILARAGEVDGALAPVVFAADGSESIAGQVFAKLKADGGAHARPELYSGRKLWWRVEFHGEAVQDCGGAFRDNVNDLADDFMSERTPLFTRVANWETKVGTYRDTWVPNLSCTNFELYEWVGRLCAAAILSEESLVLKLPPLVWKLLGGAEVAMEDLAEVDEHFYYTLLQIKGPGAGPVDGFGRPPGWPVDVKVLSPDEYEYLCMDFTVPLSDGTTRELCPGGLDMELTYANRHEFVRLAAAARLSEAADQIGAMRRGLCSVVPPSVVRLWTAAEFELAVCGSPEIPIAVLRETARYDLSKDSAEVGYMFEALEALSNEERSLFLRFVTGRARLPASIKVARSDGGHQAMPRSATCFNTIYLPCYQSKENALEKIRYAIYSCKTIDTDGSDGGTFAL